MDIGLTKGPFPTTPLFSVETVLALPLIMGGGASGLVIYKTSRQIYWERIPCYM